MTHWASGGAMSATVAGPSPDRTLHLSTSIHGTSPIWCPQCRAPLRSVAGACSHIAPSLWQTGPVNDFEALADGAASLQAFRDCMLGGAGVLSSQRINRQDLACPLGQLTMHLQHSVVAAFAVPWAFASAALTLPCCPGQCVDSGHRRHCYHNCSLFAIACQFAPLEFPADTS
jgi:hypothetical protein